MDLAHEYVVPGPAADQEIQVTAILISFAVSVVYQHLNLFPFRKPLVRLEHCRSRDTQHGMPASYVVVRANYLRQAQLKVVQIDIGATTIPRQKLATPILRIEVAESRLPTALAVLFYRSLPVIVAFLTVLLAADVTIAGPRTGTLYA